MGLFDRYLLKFFLRTLLICFLSVASLYVVIDIMNNLEEFITYGERAGGTLHVVLHYYAPRMLMFLDRTSAVFAAVAGLFVLSWMQGTNELVAVMAAGVSQVRIARPLLAAVLLVSSFAVANRELIMPRFRETLSRNAQDLLGENRRAIQPLYDNETDIYFTGRAALLMDKRIADPSLRLPTALAAFGRHLIADNAFYQKARQHRPSGYLLTGVKTPANIDELPSATLKNERPVLLTAKDTDWLKPKQCFVVSRIDFDQLAGGAGWKEYSSTRQLIAGLRNPSLDFGADVRVNVHTRLVQPLLDILLFVTVLPLVFTTRARNVFVAAGLCLSVISAYAFIVPACHFLGDNYLISPALAAWSPVLIFSPLACYVAAPLWE
jgi:lipopolysaccharide export system permease protein